MNEKDRFKASIEKYAFKNCTTTKTGDCIKRFSFLDTDGNTLYICMDEYGNIWSIENGRLNPAKLTAALICHFQDTIFAN